MLSKFWWLLKWEKWRAAGARDWRGTRTAIHLKSQVNIHNVLTSPWKLSVVNFTSLLHNVTQNTSWGHKQNLSRFGTSIIILSGVRFLNITVKRGFWHCQLFEPIRIPVCLGRKWNFWHGCVLLHISDAANPKHILISVENFYLLFQIFMHYTWC